MPSKEAEARAFKMVERFVELRIRKHRLEMNLVAVKAELTKLEKEMFGLIKP